MAIAFVCPHCEEVLRTGKDIETGKKINCPKCGGSFKMSDELLVDEEMEPVAKPARGEDKPPRRKAAAPRESEDEGNEAPAKPKKKKKKKAATVIGPDGKPKRRKKKKKKPNMGLIVGGIILGALAFFATFAGMIIFVLFRTSLDVAMLAYAPNGVEAVVGLDIGEMSNNDKILKSLPKIVSTFADLDLNKLKYNTLTENDINKIIVMRSKTEEEVTAVRYNKPFDADKLAESMGGEKSTAGDKTVYKIKDGTRLNFFFPEPDLMILFADGSKDDMLKRDPKKNAIPDTMMPILKECWDSSVFATTPFVDGSVYVMLDILARSHTKPKQLSLIIRPGSEEVDLKFVLGMNSDDDAKSVVGNKKFLDEDKNKALSAIRGPNGPKTTPGYIEAFNQSTEKITFGQSGSEAYITGRVSIEVILRLLNTPINWKGNPVNSGGGSTAPAPGGRGGRPGGASSAGNAAGVAIPSN